MARKKNREQPIPLTMVQRFNNRLPEVFENIDLFRDILKERGVVHDEDCYIPSPACNQLIRTLYPEKSEQEVLLDGALTFYLSSWRRYKQVYSFDTDFTNLLIKSALDDVVPASFLSSLPYPSIYVELGEGNDLGISGFLYCVDSYEEDSIIHKVANVQLTLYDNSLQTVIFMIDEGITIKQSIDKVRKMSDAAISDGVVDKELAYEAINDSSVLIPKIVSILMYLCSLNKDIVENATQKSITRVSTSSTSKPKDVLREVRKWDVGYRIGKTIRSISRALNTEDDTNVSCIRTNSNHSKKRPHARRGHFHHFWTGSEKDGTRKLVLKWVAPMFVNFNVEEEFPTTVTNVEQ